MPMHLKNAMVDIPRATLSGRFAKPGTIDITPVVMQEANTLSPTRNIQTHAMLSCHPNENITAVPTMQKIMSILRVPSLSETIPVNAPSTIMIMEVSVVMKLAWVAAIAKVS